MKCPPEARWIYRVQAQDGAFHGCCIDTLNVEAEQDILSRVGIDLEGIRVAVLAIGLVLIDTGVVGRRKRQVWCIFDHNDDRFDQCSCGCGEGGSASRSQSRWSIVGGLTRRAGNTSGAVERPEDGFAGVGEGCCEGCKGVVSYSCHCRRREDRKVLEELYRGERVRSLVGVVVSL